MKKFIYIINEGYNSEYVVIEANDEIDAIGIIKENYTYSTLLGIYENLKEAVEIETDKYLFLQHQYYRVFNKNKSFEDMSIIVYNITNKVLTAGIFKYPHLEDIILRRIKSMERKRKIEKILNE